jgi:hypothetical protein
MTSPKLSAIGRSQTDAATFPALRAERQRSYESRLKAAQSIPERITNSSSRASYGGPQFSVRAGADDHLSIKSKGLSV